MAWFDDDYNRFFKELARNKAVQDCRGDASCATKSALYWTDMLERAAEGRVDTQEAIKRLARACGQLLL